MWSQFTNVTDRQTDRQTTCDRNTALCTKVHRAVKNKKTAFDLHISPLCRVGPAGPIFTIFGLWGHIADVITPCQILSRFIKGLGGYGSPKLGVFHWLWMSLLQPCYALTCYTVISCWIMVWNKAVFCLMVFIYKRLQIWRHNYVISRNEYLITTFSESAIP